VLNSVIHTCIFIEDVLGQDHVRFRREKGTTDAIRMLRIIPE